MTLRWKSQFLTNLEFLIQLRKEWVNLLTQSEPHAIFHKRGCHNNCSSFCLSCSRFVSEALHTEWRLGEHLWRWQTFAVLPESVHQRLDAGAVDENGKRYRNQRQLDKLQGHLFGETVLDGIHQVVERAYAAYPEPARQAAYRPRGAGPIRLVSTLTGRLR